MSNKLILLEIGVSFFKGCDQLTVRMPPLQQPTKQTPYFIWNIFCSTIFTVVAYGSKIFGNYIDMRSINIQ